MKIIHNSLLKSLIIVFTLFHIFNFCAKNNELALSSDDYEIFDLVLDSLDRYVRSDTIQIQLKVTEKFEFLGEDTFHISYKNSSFLIIDSTYFFNTYIDNNPRESIKNSFPQISNETLTDFLTKNLNSYPIDNKEMDNKYSIEMIKKHDRNNWDHFYSKYKYPMGVVGFSKIGFNNKNDQAFLDVGFMKAELYGYGFSILFIKENNKWIIKSWQQTWMS